MPSNYTNVCVPCREVSRSVMVCPSCHGGMVTRYRWSPPKKNNNRAWKRIESGEWLWDRRRVRRKNWGWLPTDAVGRDKGRKHSRWTATWSPKTKDGANVDMGG